MSDCVLEEKEFTKMDNKILEQLIKTPLSGQEFRIILLILRKTWGWHKEEDYIALSQIQKELNICKTRASQIINRLQLMKIVTVTENINGLTKRYCFNKQFEEWIPLRKSVTVTEKRNQPLRKSVTTKESLTKENIYITDTAKKKTASRKQKTPTYTSEELSFAKQVMEMVNTVMEKNYPVEGSKTIPYRKYILEKKKEGYELKDFEKVIKNKYNNWSNNPKMFHLLRPSTLFGEKFVDYLNEDN